MISAANDRIYYQHRPERLSACPVTIHALLHIADSIEAMGPVWCYWAFPMERYCGKLQPAFRSRRFPYAALDRFVVEDAQLTQIKAIYDAAGELALQVPRGSVPGMYSHPSCRFSPPGHMLLDNHSTLTDPTCILLPPSRVVMPKPGVLNSICAALATRYSTPVTQIRKHVKTATIMEWAKVRRVDSDEGDTIRSSSLLCKVSEDSRDASFARVCITVSASPSLVLIFF